MGCKRDWQGGPSSGNSLPQRIRPWPFRPGSPALGLWDRASRGQTDSGARATEARRDEGCLHLAGRLCVFPPFSANTERENKPDKSASLQFHPPHPTPKPALTGLRHRRDPRAEEAQAVSAAQQPRGDTSQSHVGKGPASAAATMDLEERRHQNGAAPTRSHGSLRPSPLAPRPSPSRQSLPGASRLPSQATKRQT